MFDRVKATLEFKRILALPRQEPYDADTVTQYWDSTLGRVGRTLHLRPIQARAFDQARRAGGLFAPIGVGHGKALIAMLLPVVWGSACAVILLPATLKKQMEKEMDKFYASFPFPRGAIHLVTYNQLSSKKHRYLLQDLNPDCIIADEAHRLRHRTAARTDRFLKYLKSRPKVKFAALSGTMTSHSIMEYAHLLRLALKDNAPLPTNYPELIAWGGALDANPEVFVFPGALKQLCAEGENPRQGYQRRLRETIGVVATTESSVGCSLIIKKVRPRVPDVVKDFAKKVETEWKLGDVYIEEAARMTQILKHIYCGFYYQWVWPNGRDDRWLRTRNAWAREVRRYIQATRKGPDTELLVREAVIEAPEKMPYELREAWRAWEPEHHKKEPETRAVWLSDYMIQAAVKWAPKGGIVWYSHRALGEALSAYMPVYGAGDDANEATAETIACSIRAQGEGKNLQRYSRNLVLTPPPSGDRWEQMLGRTHRAGQEADEIWVEWLAPNPLFSRAMKKALDRATYVEDTTGQKQKLLYAAHI